MKGKFEFREGYSYNMPVHFRGNPVGQAANPVYNDVFMLTADIVTEMNMMAEFVPSAFEILEPVISVQYSDCRGVDWMANGEYRLLQFGVPVRYPGNDEGLTGLYQLVLWEDNAEPMLAGRENTGQPKMFADISIERHWEDRWFVRASYEGTTFFKLDFWDKKEAGSDEIASINSTNHRANTFGWRYIPKIGNNGPSLSHAVLNPSETQIDMLWHGEASISWPQYDWWENPIQATTILGMAALPVLEVRNAARGRARVILLNSEARALP